MSDKPLTLGAVLYEGFELLDMFGPLKMFTALPPELLQVVMVAEKAGPVKAGSMVVWVTPGTSHSSTSIVTIVVTELRKGPRKSKCVALLATCSVTCRSRRLRA